MNAVVGMRELGPCDEGALRALVRKVYGDTYSYRRMYEHGGIASLIGSGQVSLWGDFTDAGEIASHTGFFYKDPRGDYVESGMSLRAPGLRPVTTDTEVWRRFFAWLAGRFAYVHQNTTSYHPLAQRYAERYMRAVPAGLIVDYAVGERLAAITCTDAPMHALMMTTTIAGHPQREVRVPVGPWAEWLAGIATGLGLVPIESRGEAIPLATTTIEHNAALDLVRRSIDPAGAAFARACARIDLVHVPLDDRLGAVDGLVAVGYVPVGLRPQATRPHELVMQHLAARPSLATMRLAPAGAALVAGWCKV
ncbi:MAG: hypothetical protein ABI867_30455 [Kofleriaceae bacterium]